MNVQRGIFLMEQTEKKNQKGMKENISRYSVERIDDCLRRVIRRHQTSRSSSGIVYLALALAWGAQDSLGGLGTPVFVATIMLIYLPIFLSFLLFLFLSLSFSLERQPRFPSPSSATICRAHKKSWQLEREIEPIDTGRARNDQRARLLFCRA